MRHLLISSFIVACLGALTGRAGEPPPARATMRQFMGLNVHTVQFKPDLYKPICRLLRDYHPLDWDTGEDTSHATTFPLAANRVDWSDLYGKWTKAGYELDACVMFDKIKPDRWKGAGRDARAYGEAFARFFGPSGQHPWVSSVEIGNEPSDYSEARYRTVFEAMARGLRAGDPKLKIVTCAMAAGKADQWSKPMSAVDGLDGWYDVLNVHSYPFKDAWPTWRRSYPEDPKISFLKSIRQMISWRDAHARDKKIWLTEFGYDSATRPPAKDGPWSQWVGVSDAEQARYIVRAFLVLSSIDIDRAYLYFFNDSDEAQLHGASGITRNFQPKPSFYAIGNLNSTLGDYRFASAVAAEEGDLYCFEYQKGKSPERIYVAWLATAGEKTARKTLAIGDVGKSVFRAERLATNAAKPQTVDWKATEHGVELDVTETPTFIWVH